MSVPWSKLVCWSLFCLACQGCTSFYSAAVLGHDAAEVPFPERKAQSPSAEVDLSLKTSPTTSFFTDDGTLSVLGSATVYTSFVASPNAVFCVGDP